MKVDRNYAIEARRQTIRNSGISFALRMRELAKRQGRFESWGAWDEALNGYTCNSCGEFRRAEDVSDEYSYLGDDVYCKDEKVCGMVLYS